MPRVGLDHIRAVVVDDSEGIAERLDAAVQEHVDTYVDPWPQGAEPATPGQFRTSLPLEVLPQVPVGPGRAAARRSVVTPTTQTGTGVAHRLGPVDQIPLGEGRAFDVDGEQVAVFRLRDGSAARGVGGLPAQGRADRRRPDRRPDRALPAAPERVRPRHRLLDHRRSTPCAPTHVTVDDDADRRRRA